MTIWQRTHIAVLILGLIAGYITIETANPAVGQAINHSPKKNIKGSYQGQFRAGAFISATTARADGEFSQAAQYYLIAFHSDPDNSDLALALMRMKLASGHFNDASAIARNLIGNAEHDALSRIILAIQELSSSDYTAALSLVNNLDSQGLNSHFVNLLKAWANAGLGNASEASDLLKALSEVTKTRGIAAFHGALIADYLDLVDIADIGYRQSMEMTQNASLRVVESWANFLQRHNRTDEAIVIYKGYLELDPQNTLVEAKLASANRGSSVSLFVNSPNQGLAEACLNIANEYARNGEAEDAIIFIQIATHLRPEFDMAKLVLASILESLQKWEPALRVYRSIGTDSAHSWNAKLGIANSLDHLNRPESARSMLEAMARNKPRRTDALIALGDMMRLRESWEEAISAYDRAFTRITTPTEQDWALLYTRGIALERSGRWNRAENDFLHALKLKPNQPFVLNYLGYSWVEQGKHFKRALNMLRKATSIRPRDGYITDSLGWAYYRLGRYDQAVSWLERSATLIPNDPVINDHLGDAYWHVGRHVEAKFQWRRALYFKPDAKDVPRIEGKLDLGIMDSPDEIPSSSHE